MKKYLALVFTIMSALCLFLLDGALAEIDPIWPCQSGAAWCVTTLYYNNSGAHSTKYDFKNCIDIAGGGNIVAIADGTIEVKAILTNSNGSYRSFGKYIIIRHDDGSKSLYAHLSSFADGIAQGVRVSRGQVIGVMGDTGNADGVHLHFEYSAKQSIKM